MQGHGFVRDMRLLIIFFKLPRPERAGKFPFRGHQKGGGGIHHLKNHYTLSMNECQVNSHPYHHAILQVE